MVPPTPPPASSAASATRARLSVSALEAAPLVLGATLTHSGDDDNDDVGTVSIRITEVEAYLGPVDPGSHAFRGRTARNNSMFGPAGHLYVYFTYGMHHCVNVVCGTDGWATGLLLRAGEVTGGLDLARQRRNSPKSDLDLARGPARLARALGLDRRHDGMDALARPFTLALPPEPVPDSRYSTGPRVGVSGAGGTLDYPWRFWLPEEPTV